MVPPPAAEQKGAFSVFVRLVSDLREKIWLEMILAPTEIKIEQVYLRAAACRKIGLQYLSVYHLSLSKLVENRVILRF
jgi:hypothetical protein